MRFATVILALLLASCAAQPTLQNTAALARLQNVERQITIEQIVAKQQWLDDELQVLRTARDSINAFRTEIKGAGINAIANAPELFNQYILVADQYAQAWTVIETRKSDFRASWRMIEQWHIDAMVVHGLVMRGIDQSDQAGIDPQLVRDAVSVLSVLVKVIAVAV